MIDSIDEKALLAHLDDDRDLLRSLISIYSTNTPLLLQRLNDAINANDTKEVSITAHTLKGTCRHFLAREAARLAERIEDMARAGNLDTAAENYRSLTLAVKSLTTQLEGIQQQMDP